MEDELTLIDYLSKPISELVNHPNFSFGVMQKAFKLAEMNNEAIMSTLIRLGL